MKRFTLFTEAARCSRPLVFSFFLFGALIFLIPATQSGCNVPPATSSGDDVSWPRAIFSSSESREDVILNLEVARSEKEKAQGLMNRRSLAADAGMIFVFERPVTMPFWMKDTYLPLSIAFVSADGLIVDIQDMSPLSTEIHTPAAAYSYAIETNQGFFATHHLKRGDTVKIENV